MLAALILGVGLTVVLTGASRCLAVMKQAREFQRAQWALDLGALEHPILFVEDIKEAGVDGEEYDGVTFSREVEEDDDEDGLYVVRSRASWGEEGKGAVEEVVEYVYQPPEEEAAAP